MTRSMWTWPAIIVASAVATGLAVMCGVSPAVRVVLALWFLLVCPGMAVVRLLRIRDRSSEFALAVACSLGIESLLATTMVYAGLWSPLGGLALLVGITITGAILQIVVSKRLSRKSGIRTDESDSVPPA